jgi:hypothetical protein
MWATNEVLRFAAAAVAGLLGAVLLRDHRRNPTALASVALLGGVAEALASADTGRVLLRLHAISAPTHPGAGP